MQKVLAKLQKLGKALMLPVACLPVAGILMGIGYMIDSNVMSGLGDPNVIAFFLVKAGGAIIDNMPILFAIGVAIGLSDDHEGTSALAGLVSWLMVQQILNPSIVAVLTGAEADAAFSKANNQFIGIICGVVGALCYNRFKNTKLPEALSFFSGKRSVAIVTALVSVVVGLIFFFVWPVVYNALVSFGEAIISLGAIGAGIYGFFNRLLIPVGLHHALNSVFWFDVAGINDIANFWGGTGTPGVTGMYMSGFFPVMMFGLPGAALAMYHTSKPGKKKIAGGILFSAALCAFISGVTEPLEFSFMFLAPALYVIHAVLTGISMAVIAALPIRAGFNFSAGFVDLFFSSWVPLAQNPWLLIPIGIVVGVIYYIVFRFVIVKFNLKTPGREDDDDDESEGFSKLVKDQGYDGLAKKYVDVLGGKENIKEIESCITRIRLVLKSNKDLDEKAIKALGASGVMKAGDQVTQVIVGTKAEALVEAMKNYL